MRLKYLPVIFSSFAGILMPLRIWQIFWGLDSSGRYANMTHPSSVVFIAVSILAFLAIISVMFFKESSKVSFPGVNRPISAVLSVVCFLAVLSELLSVFLYANVNRSVFMLMYLVFGICTTIFFLLAAAELLGVYQCSGFMKVMALLSAIFAVTRLGIAFFQNIEDPNVVFTGFSILINSLSAIFILYFAKQYILKGNEGAIGLPLIVSGLLCGLFSLVYLVSIISISVKMNSPIVRVRDFSDIAFGLLAIAYILPMIKMWDPLQEYFKGKTRKYY